MATYLPIPSCMWPTNKNILFLFVNIFILCVFQLFQSLDIGLSFNRNAIECGEFWRLLTGGLVHANVIHLLMNVAGLCCLELLYDDLKIKFHVRCLGIIFLVFGINSFLYLFLTSTHFYFGFSGALHGLFVWHSLKEWQRTRSWFPLIILSLLIGKLIIDASYENNISSQLIGMRVHWQAHWIGAFMGGIISFCTRKDKAT